MSRLFPAVLAAALAAVPAAHAQNIDLSTVPARDAVELTIYNSEDLTLVRDTRTLSFSRGTNRLQLGWAGTLIDPTSVEIRFPQAAERLRLVDTVFPYDRPQTLIWEIESEHDGAVQVEITYFTSGLTWTADYVVIADETEARARIEGFVRVHNHSGEEYAEARVRVVVGTINLVEKIAELARVPMEDVGRLERRERDALRLHAAKRMMLAEAAAPATAGADTREKAIIKEGLSEYFIYSIEGTETVPNGWSKRLRSFEAAGVPLDVRYRYRPEELGDRLVRLYLTRNDEASGLGTTPLPGGEVRVFRDAAGDGLAFIAARTIDYVPVGDRLELDLGEDQDVVFERELLRTWREEVWLRLARSSRYRRVKDGVTVVDREGEVVGWDTHSVHAQRIRNFTPRPIHVEVRQQVPGDATFVSELSPARHDYQTVDLAAHVEPGETRDLLYEIVTREGRNATQSRLAIETRAVERPRY